MSGPTFGQCPTTRDWLKESNGNPLTGRDFVKAPPTAPRHLDDTDNVMRNLALKKISAFAGIGQLSCLKRGELSYLSLEASVTQCILFSSCFNIRSDAVAFSSGIFEPTCTSRLGVI